MSSTNWANCQGSMKHKLETPRATMAVLLGFRVLGREERQRKGKKKKRNRVVRECGCRDDKGGCIKTAEKTHTHTRTHIQFHRECTTKSGLCTQPASEIRHGVHSPFKAAGRRSHSLPAALTQHKVASAS